MKTNLEIQHNNRNHTSEQIIASVKNELKGKVKLTLVDDLKVYFVPDTQKAHYVAKLKTKNDTPIEGTVDLAVEE